MNTVNLHMRLTDAKKTDVVNFFNQLKSLQDVPCEELNIDDKDGILDVVIKYPLRTFDKTASQFLAVLFGEFPYMRSFGEVEFRQLDLPDEVWAWFGGPKFGAEGIKERIQASSFPLTMAIIKPSIKDDLTVKRISQMVEGPIKSGFSFVKDDEMQGDFSYAPLTEKLKFAQENYHYVSAANLDSETEYIEALQEPKGMVILNATVIGFPLLNRISRKTNTPILSHLSLQGTYRPSFSPRLYAKLHRLFGADALITPIGDTHYYRTSLEEEAEMITALTEPAPVPATLPFLTGGGTLENAAEIVNRVEKLKSPYGLVFGTQVFGSKEEPEKAAKKVIDTIQQALKG